MAVLDLVFAAGGHAVVAQVIETEFGVRSVGNVTIILGAPHHRRLIVQNATDCQAEEFVNRSHPFAVARRQVIIDGDDMHAAASEGVQINRQGGDEGLAFAGRHFRDLPSMEGDAANELDVKGNHFPLERMAAHHDFLSAQTAAGRFDHGIGFREDFLEAHSQFREVLDF